MKQHLQAIMDKEMNRREFLGYIGAGILAVVGISGMIKALLSHDNRHQTAQIVNHGYGSTAYGGGVEAGHN